MAWHARLAGLTLIFAVGVGGRASAGATAALEFQKVEFRAFSGMKVDAESATLVVPERHGAPGGRTISLPVLRFPTTSAAPKSPIVYLAGGPGGSGLLIARTARFAIFQALREVADVVTFDQRGTGAARPSMTCRQRLELPLDQPGSKSADFEALLARCRARAEHLRSQGNELAAYTTNESADDLDQLRAALGAEKISLWGTSYGTHLSLAYTRRHPDRVERLILAGVEGPDHTLKLPSDQEKQLRKLSELAKADPQISATIPDLFELVRTILERVDHEPAVAEVTTSGSTKKMKVAIGKWDLQRLTSNAIGRIRTAKSLPALYAAMSQGDYSRAARAIVSLRREPIDSSMSYLMDCASGASPERLAQIQREARECVLGDAINFPFPDIQAAWKAPDLGPEFRGPLKSPVPALFISGSLDGRTPPSNAEEIRAGFPHGIHLIIEGASHDDDLFAQSEEMRRRMVAFAAGQPISTEPIKLPPFQFDWPARK